MGYIIDAIEVDLDVIFITGFGKNSSYPGCRGGKW